MADSAVKRPVISIVCPVFNEENAVPLFYERLQSVLRSLEGFTFELIFTNNRSLDGTLAAIRKLQEKDPSVYVLTFSRNFGYQASVLAGITHARGDAIIIIDVDCEDPPELIPTFVEKWRAGHDICYGIRGKRPEAWAVTALRRLFYRILHATADSDIILDMAEFSLISRRVRNAIIRNKNTFPFLRAEIAFSGFKKVGIHYDRQRRIVGRSNYKLWDMAVFATAGILTVSTFPLRAAAYALPIMAVLNLAGFVLLCMGRGPLFEPLILLDAIYLMMMVAAQGLYVARIYKNGIGRPVYIVDWDQSDEVLHRRAPRPKVR